MTVQRWSLGVFGDLLWDHVPELRPGIKEQVCERLRTAIVLEEEPEAPDAGDYNYVIAEARRAIEQDRAEPGVLEHLIDFIWAALRYSGPEAGRLKNVLALYVLERMDNALLLPKLRQADPELVKVVHELWGMW